MGGAGIPQKGLKRASETNILLAIGEHVSSVNTAAKEGCGGTVRNSYKYIVVGEGLLRLSD